MNPWQALFEDWQDQANESFSDLPPRVGALGGTLAGAGWDVARFAKDPGATSG